jgi:Cu-processing system permease protein
MTDDTQASPPSKGRTEGGDREQRERDTPRKAEQTDGGVVADTGLDTSNPASDDSRRLGLERVFAVAAQEYRLSFRNRWAVALTGLFALVAVLLVVFGGSKVGPSDTDSFVASLVVLSTYLVPLAALAFGYDAVVGPAENGWLDVVFALPVPRSQVVLGTYLGRAATLAGATLVGFGVAGVALVARTGSVGIGAYGVFVLAAAAVSCAFLAMSVLISTAVGEKTRALGLALLAWVWFVLAHDLVALGVISAVGLPDVALSAMVLANPADIFRVLVLSQLETTSTGLASVLTEANLSVSTLTAALLAWTAGPVLVAARLIRRVKV